MSLRHSITLRLSLAFALLATLVFAALGVYLSRSADQHMAELDAHELMGKLALARHVGTQEMSPAALASRLADALVGEHGVMVAVDGEKGAIFRWPASSQAGALASASAEIGETPVRLNLAGQELRVVAGMTETGWGETARVVVARDIHHHTAFLDQLQRDFWLAVLAAALLTVIVGMLIARRGMRPVLDLAQAAGRISAGQLAERIPENNVPPELAELVQAFNAMLGRLEESFQRLSDFSADLAHELRTPIHSLRMQTEVSLSKTRSVDDYRDLLASNLEEYERLARIIADMLFLAKADHGLVIPQREPIALMALCERLFEYYGLLAEHLDFRLEGESPTVPGDRLMLQRAIGNLLVNAINHTPPSGSIVLSLSQEAGLALIRVSNTGVAIPPEAIERIFDRFVRLDQGGEGSGLGLAITRSIVLAHGGSIEVTAFGQKTEFCIRLPL
ncbi:MAG: heavy metal sensor histidine kinase [Azonexus sp.]|nr:heavy metal sensor histidine kinase [Azonexus sp.]